MIESLRATVPELCLLVGAVAGLLAGLYLPRRHQRAVAVITGTALLAAAAAALVQAATGAPPTAYEGTYTVDTALQAVRVVVPLATLFVIGLATGPLRGNPRETELYVLLVLSALGTVALAGAADLLVLVTAYLLATIPGYALAGFGKDPPGTEAAVKYFLFGALSGVVTLAGVTAWYGLGHSTGYADLARELVAVPAAAVAAAGVAVLAAPLFKAGAVPGHFWVPDVAEGARTPVAAFLTTVPKLGALVALLRLAGEVAPDRELAPLVAAIAAATMTLGNLAAFFQAHPRRLLGYSTISQAGYLLLAVAAAGADPLAEPALLYYLVAYAAANLGGFAVVAAVPGARRIADFRGVARRRPALAVALVVCLLSLVGTPPLAGFVGKLGVFVAAAGAGLGWLVVLAAVNTVASLFYYLRWIVAVLRTGPAVPGAPDRAGAAGLAYLAAALTLGLGLASGPLLAALA